MARKGDGGFIGLVFGLILLFAAATAEAQSGPSVPEQEKGPRGIGVPPLVGTPLGSYKGTESCEDTNCTLSTNIFKAMKFAEGMYRVDMPKVTDAVFIVGTKGENIMVTLTPPELLRSLGTGDRGRMGATYVFDSKGNFVGRTFDR